MTAAEQQEVLRPFQPAEFALGLDLIGITAEKPDIPNSARIVAAAIVGIFRIEFLRFLPCGTGYDGIPVRRLRIDLVTGTEKKLGVGNISAQPETRSSQHRIFGVGSLDEKAAVDPAEFGLPGGPGA